MLKFVKISLLTIALPFAANSGLVADNCIASDCDQVATRETQDRNEKENYDKMTRMAKVASGFRNLIKPGGPTKAADKAFDAIFGKDTFSRKVATGAFPKIVTVLTTKIMINKMFENLKVSPKVENGALTGLGKWANNDKVRSWLVNEITTQVEIPNEGEVDAPKQFRTELTVANATLLGSIVSNHQLKEVTDILAGTILGVWLTNK